MLLGQWAVAPGISAALLMCSGRSKPLPVSAAWERDAGDQAVEQKRFLTAMQHYGM